MEVSKMLQYLLVVTSVVIGATGVSKSSSSSSSSPSSSTGVKSLVTVDDRCDGQMQQVQSAVIQLLSAQYEHKRGIDKLQMLTDHVQKDITHIKSHIDDLDKYVTADKARNSVSGDVSSLPAKPSLYTSSSSQSAMTSSSRDEEESRRRDEYGQRVMQQNQLIVNRSLESVTSRLDNITALLAKEMKRIHDLDRRYKRLQRSLADPAGKVMHHHETVAKVTDGGGKVQQDEADMEHFVNKQREINGQLQNRLRNLEQQITAQSDEPAVSVQTGCPPSFTRHYTSCYKFENITLNWVDAEKHCQSLHHLSHLVGIEKREEHDFIISFRNYNDAQWNSAYMWTGANDMAAEGKWVWVGTHRPVTFTFWRAGEPDNHNGDQHCMYLRADGGDSRWDDWHCRAARLTFVCEIVMTL